MANRFLAAIRVVIESARRGGFRVALIGGFALPFHGVRRATGDVDFLVEGAGADQLVADLGAAGLETLHRSLDAANFASRHPDVASIDVLFARRPATIAMLDRAAMRTTREGDLAVPVVDVEGIIGLKAQAIANDPRRRRRDEEDIVQLLRAHATTIDHALLGDYFALFDMQDDLARLLDEARAGAR